MSETQSKNAELMAAIKEFWVNDEHLDICEGEDPDGLDIECAGVQAQIEAYNDSLNALASITARTPEGRQAKVCAAISALMRAGLEDESPVLRLVASVLRDVAMP